MPNRRAVIRDARRLFESLEPRALLSETQSLLGPAPTGSAWDGVEKIRWAGGDVEAKLGSWIVTLREQVGEVPARDLGQRVAERLGVPTAEVRSLGRGGWVQISTEAPVTEAAALAAMRDLPLVKAIEPDRVFATDRVPNDPRFGEQWTYDNTGQFIPGSGFGKIGADISATESWDITIGSQGVVIAVIDTGVDINHPDLKANIYTNPGEIAGNDIDDDGNGFVDDVHGWDFGELDNDPSDEQGHGTHVAGTIGAVGDNGIGVTGVAWNVSILPLKIADRFGALQLSAIVGAHDYATMMRQRGVNVAASNNSYGGFAPTFYADAPTGFDAEKDAIQRYIDSGGTFVVAAGNSAYDNDNPQATFFPASYKLPGIITVAATDNSDNLAGFSNYGAESVDLGAPGVDILSTVPVSLGSYAFFSGTSMASPTVAGAVAILKTVKPSASAIEIRSALLNSADPLPGLQGKTVSGGRLNLQEAIRIIGLDGPVVRAVVPGPVAGQLDPATGTPLNTVTVTFNKAINPSFLGVAGVRVTGAGLDDVVGTGDDVTIPIAAVARSTSDPRVVVITLNLAGFPQQRLPLDPYRLTLLNQFFKDTDGNFLNGDSAGGQDETYNFRIAGVGGDFEPNDTIALATPVVFDASGTARFNGVTLGNGLQAAKDVDLYKIVLPRGGLITAEITAKRLASPSGLDGYLRLFNARGEQIASNDQFYGADPYLDFFVSTGGEYYLGVSGFPNTAYNPTLAGSGVAQSTGTYNLTLKTDLISDDRVTYTADVPAAGLPIPTAPGATQGVTSDTIRVTDNRQIVDLNLRLDIVHTFDSDLKISLISPAGTTILLVNRRGGEGDNFTNTLLDDEAAVTVAAGLPPFTGAFRPDTALSGFDGQTAGGTWTLLINDTTALNSGTLVSWSLEFTLENNIFGPFELNDTIATARNLSGVSGTGSASVTAAIGDGGFGVLDRDLFRFTADAGTTLTAAVTAGSVGTGGVAQPATLNSALRLFNSAGQQITLANPAGTNNARIENFVFAEAGTYYIAVSESSNVAYDPFDVTTGSPAVTTGTYVLSVNLTAGVSDGDLLLAGDDVLVGVNPGATMVADVTPFGGGSATRTGLRFQGVEFLYDTSASAATQAPNAYFGAVASGSTFRNQSPAPTSNTQVSFSLTDQSDTYNRRVVAKGLNNGLRIERAFNFGVGDRFIAIDVILTNTTAAAMTGVGWMEAFNPDPGLNLSPTTANTFNDLMDGAGSSKLPYASASYRNNQYQQGLTVALAAPSADTRAKANIVDPTELVRDPDQLLDLPLNDPQGASSDSLLSLVYDLGTIGAGQTAKLRYFILFGETPAGASDLYAAINDGTGTGHLTADPASPPDDATGLPQLPYRVFYPEGYASGTTYTFVPVGNATDQANRVVLIARYETGEPRDQVLADFTVAAGSRSGVTISTPSSTILSRPNVPYALEIRSERPVAANFSHYDLFNTAGVPSSVGEAFTSTISTTWSFGKVDKAADGSIKDFVLFYNTTADTTKVVTTFYPEGGGAPVVFTMELGAYRRGGWNIDGEPDLAPGSYGVVVSADAPLVASVTHYDATARAAEGTSGMPGLGATSGVIPEGEYGLTSVDETIGVLNATGVDATVTFSFLFSGGSSYRTALTVPAGSQANLAVGSLDGFPVGQPYSVLYESNTEISLVLPTLAFGDELRTAFASQAYTYWGFGEGFRPQDGYDQNVREYLRLFNPSDTEVLAEITVRYDNGLGTETFRRTLAARTVTEINAHDLVTGSKRQQDVFYSTTIKTAVPIVAYQGHYDAFFPGAFGSLGTPLGIITPVV